MFWKSSAEWKALKSQQLVNILIVPIIVSNSHVELALLSELSIGYLLIFMLALKVGDHY